jgi:hypothetical protein
MLFRQRRKTRGNPKKPNKNTAVAQVAPKFIPVAEYSDGRRNSGSLFVPWRVCERRGVAGCVQRNRAEEILPTAHIRSLAAPERRAAQVEHGVPTAATDDSPGSQPLDLRLVTAVGILLRLPEKNSE